MNWFTMLRRRNFIVEIVMLLLLSLLLSSIIFISTGHRTDGTNSTLLCAYVAACLRQLSRNQAAWVLTHKFSIACPGPEPRTQQ